MARLDALYTGDGTDLSGGQYTIVAPGKYKAIIIESTLEEIKESAKTGARNGYKLVLNFEIVEGEYRGVRIRDNINIINPSIEAQNIGQKRKARIGLILGIGANPADSDLFLNKPALIIETTTNPDKADPKKIYNNIKEYHPANGEFEALVGGGVTSRPTAVQQPLNDTVPF